MRGKNDTCILVYYIISICKVVKIINLFLTQKFMQNKFKKAFTLIELLIVIAIIAILTVAFLPGALKAPARARDAGKIKKVQDIVAAVEAYNAQKSTYPSSETTGCLIQTQATAMNIDLPSDSVKLGECTDKSNYYYFVPAAPNNNFYVVGVAMETSNAANTKQLLNAIRAVTTLTAAKNLITAPVPNSPDVYLVVGP